MDVISRQIRLVRKRQTINRFLRYFAITLGMAAGAWLLLVLTDRLLALSLPLDLAASLAGGLALLGAIIWALIRRVSPLQAAIEIDTRARLKERISTAWSVRDSHDPFAEAVAHDAEKVVAALRVQSHVPYQAPREWPWPLAIVAAAAMLYAFLPQWNLLASARGDQERANAADMVAAKQIAVSVRQQSQRIKQRLENKPELKNLLGTLDKLDIPENPGMKPDDLRRDVVKKVESVRDQIRQKLTSNEMKMLEALKRDLAKLDTPRGDDAAAKLAQALAQGDMQKARKAMERLKQELDQAAKSGKLSAKQKAKLAEMSKKLDSLSKQLQELANKPTARLELQNKAGLSRKEAEKLLEKLKNMDPKQMEKALQQALAQKHKQLSKEQIKQMAKKIAQQQQLQQKLSQMAQAMQQAAKSCQNPGNEGQGKPGGGQMSFDSAMGMISELEMADQVLQELQADLSDLDQLKHGVCQGNFGRRWCPRSDEVGGQGLNKGFGYGAKTGKKAAAFGYKSTKVKSKLRSGEIIGEMLVDGPMIKGDVSAEAREAVNAAQRDAADAIEREEVPRQYEKVLREYFERLAGLAGASPAGSVKNKGREEQKQEASKAP